MSYSKSKKIKPMFEEDAFCGHCGKLEPFEATFKESDGIGINWCYDCIFEFVDEELVPSREDIEKEERIYKLNYYKRKIQELLEEK